MKQYKPEMTFGGNGLLGWNQECEVSLLDAGGLHRTEENEKTSSIATEFIQVFADDFSSQQLSTK